MWRKTLFADDVKLKALNLTILQRLLKILERWVEQSEMRRNTKTCAILTTNAQTTTHVKLSGDTVEVVESAVHLGFPVSNKIALADGITARIERERGKLHILRDMGLHPGAMDTGKLLNICEAFILATATYGLHLTPTDPALYEK